MTKVDQPDLALLRRFDQDRTGAIAEDDAGRTVGVVDDRRHRIRADHQNLGMNAGLNQLGPHLQGVEKTRARRGKVKTPGAVGTELVLHQAGGRGEEHVGRNRGHDDHLDLAGHDASLGKATPRCFHGHVTGRHARLDQVALADAKPLHDPLVRGVYHGRQVGVAEDAWRHIGSEGADFGAPLCTRTQFDAQYSSPELNCRE